MPRRLLALVLGAVCVVARAADGVPLAALPACETPVRFSADYFADPEVDTSKSAAEVTKLGQAVKGTEKGIQLGHVVVETKIAVLPREACSGHLVQLQFVKPVLRIASNFAPGTCAEALVRTHEYTHVKIYREMAEAFRHLQYHGFGPTNPAQLMRFAKQEWKRLEQRQILFDSPEEYAKSRTMCEGEIAGLLKAGAAAGPAPQAQSGAIRPPSKKPG